MKKRVFVLTVTLVLIALLLCGCGNFATNETYPIYEFEGGHDTLVSVTHGEYYPLTSFTAMDSPYVDSSSKKLETIVFLGKTYPVTYQNTDRQHLFPYERDNYVVTTDSDIKFSTKKNSSELVYANIYSSSDASFDRVQENVTESACRQKANDILTQYIDISKYAVSVTFKNDVYSVMYSRTMCEYVLGDSAEIVIRKNGDVIGMTVAMKGEYDRFENIVIDSQKVKNTLQNKLKTYYTVDGNSLSDYEQKGAALLVSENGDLLLLVATTAEIKTSNGTQSEMASFLVKVN